MAQSPKVGGPGARRGFDFLRFMSPIQTNKARDRRMSRKIAPVDISMLLLTFLDKLGFANPQKQVVKG